LVDTPVILRKLESLDTHYRQISQYNSITVREYDGDWKIQRITERTLQIMVEICIDVAGHIIADSGFRTPVTYADTFHVLQENGIIDDGLMSIMDKVAKFRNVVVHQYEKIDSGIVVSILGKNLDDFTRFSKAIKEYLSQSGTGSRPGQ